MFKRFLFPLLLALLLALPLAVCLGEEAPEATPDAVLLQIGDTGDLVEPMKLRLYELGYFTDTNFSKKYTSKTATAMRKFQENNGLPVTGVYTQADADVLFSDEAVPLATATPTPVPTPETPVPEENGAILLQIGDTGDQVQAMKTRLYELGYFSDTHFSVKYNETTAAAVKKFQEANGLPVTGVYTQADADVLFSDAAVAWVEPTPTPAPTFCMPTPRPLQDENAPATDSEGFLPEGSTEEYFYEEDDLGQWAYLTSGISILINRYETDSLVWFETEILLRDGNSLQTFATDPEHPGLHFKYPFDIAKEENLVLGFTDDFYGHRLYYRQTPGIIIRNGEIIASKTKTKRSDSTWPNLDMMAQFPDGSLKCYPCGSITPEELLEAGAVNVFSFGPIVITGGEMDPIVESRAFDYKNPRQFLAMIEPNHYLVLTVTGRVKDSEGIGMKAAAQMLLQRGCVEALNLDGGNTMALVFRGRMLNKLATYQNKKYVRSVGSLIGVGVSPNAIPEEDQ